MKLVEYKKDISYFSNKEKTAVHKWNKLVKNKTNKKMTMQRKRKLKKLRHRIKVGEKRTKTLYESDVLHIRDYKLYALKLKNDKYYIGITARSDVRRRYMEHTLGEGAKWTAIHKPKYIISVTELGRVSEQYAKEQEDKLTLQYIGLYGSRNVRGGRWCQVDYSAFERALLR